MAAAVAQPLIPSVPHEWPEPVQSVQILAESGLSVLPSQYVRPESERPRAEQEEEELHIPLIDLSGLDGDEKKMRMVLAQIGHACEQWGFFQIVNHGIPLPLLRRTLLVARQFFELPLHEKQAYANNPLTYEGYGSRLGVEKGAILDWGDYFFFHILPTCIRNPSKWPTKPMLWRETMEECGEQLNKLSVRLLELISRTLVEGEKGARAMQEAFEGTARAPAGAAGGEGGSGMGLAFRVNFYPPCPQPDLTLGLSSHSDPGGLTIVLQDDDVEGLQVRHDGKWASVKPLPGGLIVNLGDQIQIMSNGQYRSVEHRAVVNREKTRVSIAAFFNPSNERVVGPIKELVSEAHPPRYQSMTFGEYRSFIRRSGTKGKGLECVSSPR